MHQEKNYTERQKLEYSMKLHRELAQNYELISKMVCVCLDRGLKMVIENPYTQPHYLTNYWCIKPKVIDKDRRKNGDYMNKPTQFFFINCEPKNNLVFEALDYVPKRTVDHVCGKDRARIRSEIHPQYANRFIRQYLI